MKDVSLFNVTFNASLYKKFMTSLSDLVVQDKLTEQVEKARRHFMSIEDNAQGLLQTHDRKITSLFEANDAVNSLLKKHLKDIEAVKDQDNKVVTKYNEFDLAMNFRYGIAVQLLLTHVLSDQVYKDSSSIMKDIQQLVIKNIGRE